MGAESEFAGIIDPIIGKAFLLRRPRRRGRSRGRGPAEYAAATKAAREKIIADVADVDDVLAEKFINEEPISVDELRAAIRRATLALKMTP